VSREHRICVMAGSLIAASSNLDVRRALVVAQLIVDLIIKIQEARAGCWSGGCRDQHRRIHRREYPP
jgi:hypothetical protein